MNLLSALAFILRHLTVFVPVFFAAALYVISVREVLTKR
jgi:hypothetical protein